MQQLPCKMEKSNVDWSGFPSDLLFVISQRLSELSDFIRFRSVCKNWRLSAPRSVSPPQLPWLIKFYCMKITYVSSLSSCKDLIIEVPQMVKKMKWIGAGKTYILACDCENNSVSLMNPLTDEEHPLPPLPEYICTIKPVRISSKDDITLLCYPKKIFGGVFFCRIDGERWSIVECKRESILTISCTYYQGMYFVIWGSSHGREMAQPTEIINATTGQVVAVINPPPGIVDNEYMVESSGEILRVQLLHHFGHSFRIYLLDYGGSNSRWIQLRSIGDRILFLANPWLRPNSCLYGFTLRSCNINGSKGNCIYLFAYGNDGHCLYRYDIEDNTAELLRMSSLRVSIATFLGDWFVPSLH
ncbi:F-box protein SKIP23 [Rhynchospora pubera]|uniref:F-box protein SKIP23 n=1 Tax=Rhynchospora pubera TaxID=906938 RepID=A0AAV8H6N8_9POAL|nr:F-box protein SKIP23 [Rhynchospora pubera]KAJ4811605.1 F-box protein SKIP23 [Rhynchospora pubera]